MKSTENSTNVLFSEQQKLTQYIGLITAERDIYQRRASRLLITNLSRIRAKKEVFRLNAEIEAKQKYLDEIEKSIQQNSPGRAL